MTFLSRIIDYKKRTETPCVVTNGKIKYVRQSSTKSLRKLALQARISLIQRATKVHLHPYRIHVLQELKESLKAQHWRYCRWLGVHREKWSKHIVYAFVSDEACLTLPVMCITSKIGCGIIKIHMSSKNCPCILRLGMARCLLSTYGGTPFLWVFCLLHLDIITQLI